jgi:peptide/nickel transport system permease protein
VILFSVTAMIGSLFTGSPFELGNDILVPPNQKYLMGSDDLGRDVFARFVFGFKVTLTIGFLAALLSLVIGIPIGSLAGYYGGWVDDLLMRITDVFMVIPSFFLAVVVAVIFGSSIGFVIFVIGILYWPAGARLIRAEFLSLREREFVQAAKAVGAGDLYIAFKEILPNALPPSIVNASLQIAAAILLESGLSFLGLGDPAIPSWGMQLNAAQNFLRSAWWMAAFPGMGIFLITLSMNLVGDGLNDALNPRLKE